MTMTRKTLAKKLLKHYRIARKQYTPALSRIHAYFTIGRLIAQTQFNKYNARYWKKAA
jgi:hypothetical protein